MYLLPLACPGWNTFWQKYCCILTKENIDPSHYLWPNYLHYSSVLTYILFLSLPLLIFIFPPQFAFASQYIFPLYPHASLPSPFKPPSSLHVLVGGGIFNPSNQSFFPHHLLLHSPQPLHHGSSSTTCSPTPWPTTFITLRGENKNHHSSYLPSFWIDLSISTSAPLRLFYLSTCLTLLVALLSL